MPFEREPNTTEKQAEVWDFIISFIETYGFQPSMPEIAEHFGVTRKAIRDRIHQLAGKGLVELPGRYQDRCLKLNHVTFKAQISETLGVKDASG